METTQFANPDLEWKAPTDPEVDTFSDTEEVSFEAPTTTAAFIALYRTNPELALQHMTYKHINAVADAEEEELAIEMLAKYHISRSQA